MLTLNIVVLVGHTKCGGVEAALKYVRGIPQDPLPPSLLRWLQPLITLAQRYKAQPPNFDDAVELLVHDNIIAQV